MSIPSKVTRVWSRTSERHKNAQIAGIGSFDLFYVYKQHEKPSVIGMLEKQISNSHLRFCRRFRWICTYRSDKFIWRMLRANILAAVFVLATDIRIWIWYEKYFCSSPKIIWPVYFYFFVATKFHAFSNAAKFRENPYLE